jgi:hypothetical protein
LIDLCLSTVRYCHQVWPAGMTGMAQSGNSLVVSKIRDSVEKLQELLL